MVIGILSVLVAIVLPLPRMVRTAALKRQAKVEATALAQAAIRYKSEYGFWPGEMMAYNNEELIERHKDTPVNILARIVAGPKDFTDELGLELNGVEVDGKAYSLYLNTNEVFKAFNMVGYPNGSGRYKSNPLNPKMISFLDLKNATDFENVNFLDPWGEPYRLVMGLPPRNWYPVTPKGNKSIIIVAVSNATAFAYSLGPKGDMPGNTNYIFSAGVGR